jgi:hypothetical protein
VCDTPLPTFSPPPPHTLHLEAECFTTIPGPNPPLPALCFRYSELLRHNGEAPVAVRRCETVEEVLREADVSGLLLWKPRGLGLGGAPDQQRTLL